MTGQTPRETQTAHEALEMHLAQAITRCESPAVEEHLRAALQHCRKLPPTPLVECPVCGVVGLPERIQAHNCER
ncbi:uncharacterized protein OE_6168B1R (plasmid) [Halobacterium salinarum R1]|uniref:Uncharacterized protein n=1 Tax=Halobacterium salinarum (strain ATCC 29341 / DSM 671 / R1) TaxID=478009 RepID=A0A0C7TC55_HALS3|nr:uncharacterized protein OE_6168B1R [Halobacterium salinarum R1]